MNNQQRQQVVEQLKSSNHVLVTVSANPTVDELAASIGLTLAINKMNKHATTVFSGVVPSTIEFLQPEKTIETTTDSLRDFIISLDKSKADKLRYKVEDDVVRIFITPYRTTISDKDLEYSQGDFNVDLVIALGVTQRQDLDKAITAHGRILHDATIITVTKQQDASDLGSINWQDEQASSFCEMLASVITEIDDKVLDGQMATSLLTGIIAETDRFKNANTTPVALSLSSQLMQAGANQQLIAEKLDEPEAAPELHVEEKIEEKTQSHGNNGELEIDHSENEIDKIHIDDHGNLNLSKDDGSEGEVSTQNDEVPQEPEELNGNEVYQEPEAPNDLDQNTRNDSYMEEAPPREPSDLGGDLFDDLVTQDNQDSESQPTLKQPESGDTAVMTHEKVITPPTHPGDLPKSDKPFDPNEAMAAAGLSNTDVSHDTTETDVSASSEEPQVQVPEAQEEEKKPEPQTAPEPIQVPEPVVPLPVSVETPSQVPPVPAPEPLDQKPQVESSGKPTDTLDELEKAVNSPHVVATDNDKPTSDPEIAAAHPPELEEAAKSIMQDQTQSTSLEPPTVAGIDTPPKVENNDPNAPPPVPPPMTPQFYDADGNNSNPFKSQ